jgi:hypothetical protein
MILNPDFRDLLAALNAEGAEYLVVGGHAVAFHAVPRFTKDLDIWLRCNIENAERVMRALSEFGAPLAGVAAKDFATPDMVFMMGVPPNRIDLLTSIDGVDFDEAWRDRVATNFSGEPTAVIGKVHLLANKIASGRPQDLVDADVIRKMPASPPGE